ncbi:hypothetical protein Sked_05470 [Sanguibacter keddieii DSM 10542]|uniref:Uncharacterized protein n=1 Tax=Sanguibacter keddieii (strain ATCC 51767 / DSM 10542 / NCFB 3025 / ST-74) TaxID=446469 RepID=D1BAF6_SANKS|nr:hypothetical protein [Sanguibacter keddieii]ACZ20507.1 hypothetical protein Sked_05470 [Sanguibacter keddieii DSM 10542]
MSTTPRKTARLVVAGLTGTVLALVPVAAVANDTTATTANPTQATNTTPSASATDRRYDRPVTITSPQNGAVIAAGTHIRFSGTGTPGAWVMLWIFSRTTPSDSGHFADARVGADGRWTVVTTSPRDLLAPGQYSMTAGYGMLDRNEALIRFTVR